ncbi:anti-repressor SinI family protein [Fictibacillus sp. NRS-1165]|uniref:anti-repressor SinI family protein n=1 Tax=Fictibacillus sp. NRS-1165 TaxID=3144463 RepID=UPI003D1F5CCA
MGNVYNVVAKEQGLHRNLRVVADRSNRLLSILRKNHSAFGIRMTAHKVKGTPIKDYMASADDEWVELIVQAKKLGLSREEIQSFLQKPTK